MTGSGNASSGNVSVKTSRLVMSPLEKMEPSSRTSSLGRFVVSSRGLSVVQLTAADRCASIQSPSFCWRCCLRRSWIGSSPAAGGDEGFDVGLFVLIDGGRHCDDVGVALLQGIDVVGKGELLRTAKVLCGNLHGVVFLAVGALSWQSFHWPVDSISISIIILCSWHINYMKTTRTVAAEMSRP